MTTELESSATHVDGAEDAPAAPFTGTDRFTVVRELGAGGMGVVYLARDRERGGEVALKTLARLDPQALYRFKHEFRALADLSHPNLVGLGELICDDGRWFFTMEFVDGVDFVRHARPHGPRRSIDAHAATRMSDTLSAAVLAAMPAEPPRAQAAPVLAGGHDDARLRPALAQLVAGLAALHDAGMVHRDVKPGNVLCRADGRVIVLDFGLVAEVRAQDEEEAGSICGTPDYMAPEQVALEPVGPAADWYAVGVMLFEVLTGTLPFTGQVAGVLWQKLHAEPPPLPDDVPPDLAALCADLLRRDPAARPGAAEILRRLHAAAPTPTPHGEPAPEAAFVGRDRELARLAELLAHSRQRPTMVVVSGESGLGKTTLVERFLARLAPGTLVLHGRCFERESVPYKAFDGAVDDLSNALLRVADVALPDPATLAALRRVFPVLCRVPAIAGAEAPDVANLTELRWLAFRGLRRLLAGLAARGPLVVCIDDLHWADGDSLVLLAELLGPGPAPPRALFLATSRTRANLPGATSEPIDLPLTALTPAESERLVAALTRSRESAAAIAREARGHPLFIRELCVCPQGAAAIASVEDALYARVAALEPEARAVMAYVATAGEPIAQALAARAADLEWTAGARCVDALRRAHLCRTLGARPGDPIEPYHDRVRRAVLAHLGQGGVVEHSRRLAALLEQDGAGDTAPHLLVQLFAASGELAKAARYAEHAAVAAARALAFEHAAQLYRSALEYGAEDLAHARRLALILAETLGHAGRGADAAAVYLAVGAQASDDPSVALRCKAEAACHQIGCGRVDEGLATAAEVLGVLGEPWPETQRHAVARLLWHRLRLRLRGAAFVERPLSAIPEAQLVRLDTFDQIATNVGAIDPLTAGAYQARAARLALDAGERGRIVRALAKEACFVALGGTRSSDRARAAVDRVLRLVVPGQNEHAAWAATATGFVAYLEGRFAEAYPLIAEAERRFTAGPVRHFAGLLSVRLFRLLSARQLGMFAEIRRSLEIYLRDAAHRGDRHAQNTLTRALNLAWLVADDPAEARRRIDASTWVAPTRGLHQQHLYDLLARVDVALYTDDRDEQTRLLADAERMNRSLLVRVQSNRCSLRHAVGRLALALAGPHLARVERVADDLAREGLRLGDLLAGLLRAGLAVQRREPGRAAALLEVVAASSHGLDLYPRVARFRLAELGRGDRHTAAQPLHREGVVDPARLVQTFAPGFHRDA